MNDSGACLCGCGWRTQRMACERCERRIAGQLSELVEFYALLGAELLPGSPAPSDGSRHTKADAAPLPCSLEVLNLRHRGGMVAMLAEWEADWRDTFGLTAPTFRGSTEQTLSGTIEFLTVWLPRAAIDHPAVDVFAEEVRKAHSACRSLLGQRDDLFSPGRCPVMIEDVDAEPAECGGKLLVDRWGQGLVTCRSCGTEWDRSGWLLLGSQLNDPRNKETSA